MDHGLDPSALSAAASDSSPAPSATQPVPDSQQIELPIGVNQIDPGLTSFRAERGLLVAPVYTARPQFEVAEFSLPHGGHCQLIPDSKSEYGTLIERDWKIALALGEMLLRHVSDGAEFDAGYSLFVDPAVLARIVREKTGGSIAKDEIHKSLWRLRTCRINYDIRETGIEKLVDDFQIIARLQDAQTGKGDKLYKVWLDAVFAESMLNGVTEVFPKTELQGLTGIALRMVRQARGFAGLRGQTTYYAPIEEVWQRAGIFQDKFPRFRSDLNKAAQNHGGKFGEWMIRFSREKEPGFAKYSAKNPYAVLMIHQDDYDVWLRLNGFQDDRPINTDWHSIVRPPARRLGPVQQQGVRETRQ